MADDLTTLATFFSPVEAAVARNFLESEGVPALLADDATVGMAWHLTGAVGGVKLLVANKDAPRALALLESRENNVSEDNDSADDDDDNDLDESEDDEDEPQLSPADETADRAFRAAILGLLLCPLQIYSLYLLSTLLFLPEAPNPKMQQRAAIAAVLDVAVIVYVYLFFGRGWM